MASGIDLSENEMYDTAKAKEKEIWDRMQVLEDILQNAVADNEKK